MSQPNENAATAAVVEAETIAVPTSDLKALLSAVAQGSGNGAVAQANAFQSLQSSKRDALEFFAKYPDQMTVDQLCEAGLPIYLQNNINGTGRVAVDFSISGKTTTVTIPTGWLPVCLNDRMSPNDIRSSGSLRDHLHKGSVIILHPTTAMELLNSPRGQRELSKHRSSHTKGAGSAPIVNSPKATKIEIEGATNVSGKMQMFVIELEKAKGADARQEILDKIFANLKAFTADDIEYFKIKTAGDNVAQQQAEEMLVEFEKRASVIAASYKS